MMATPLVTTPIFSIGPIPITGPVAVAWGNSAYTLVRPAVFSAI